MLFSDVCLSDVCLSVTLVVLHLRAPLHSLGEHGRLYLYLHLTPGNQEPSTVRDKVGRAPWELGVSKSVDCNTFSLLCSVKERNVGWKNQTTRYILPLHWLYEWFSHFHSCGTYSVLSRSHSSVFCGTVIVHKTETALFSSKPTAAKTGS